MKILVTGGAGYIGSHTCVELLQTGYEVVVVDNFDNSKPEAIHRIEELANQSISFYEADVRDEETLRGIFAKEHIDAVIHFAGLKAVGESVRVPLKYYNNNLISTLVLLDVMNEFGVKNFVFSSSATVYGNPSKMPITEDFPLSTTNPYGTTKLMLEQILKDAAKADTAFNPVILRYFNPVGAHESGRIGEDPNGIPNNLMPYVVRVANGELKELSVFGNDYNTHDGTGVRDYIHVVDLAKGHISALDKLDKEKQGLFIYNLGTGTGYSVLDMVKAFENATGKDVPYKITTRRPGDIATCYADPKKAKEELGWQATKTLDDMCRDSWTYIENRDK